MQSASWQVLCGSVLSGEPQCHSLGVLANYLCYLKKIRVFKAGKCLNTLAWINEIGHVVVRATETDALHLSGTLVKGGILSL